MTQTIINDSGETIEIPTTEEIEAQKQQAIEEYKSQNPDKTEELTKLQKELDGFKDKDLNFSNLRKQKEDAEKKVEDILKGVDEKISTVKKEVLEGVMKDHYNETINSLTGGDEELKKKIEFQYKRLGDAPATKDEIAKKLQDAYMLAAGTSKGVSSNAFSSGGVGSIKTKESSLTEDDKDLLKKMGKGHLAK